CTFSTISAMPAGLPASSRTCLETWPSLGQTPKHPFRSCHGSHALFSVLNSADSGRASTFKGGPPMPPVELKNSRRMLDKVTYTPLKLPESEDGGGALETATAVSGLSLIPGEATSAAADANRRVADALDLMERLTTAVGPGERLAASSELARTSTAVLADAVDAIRKQREAAIDHAVAQI